jgi:hypothetical protein
MNRFPKIPLSGSLLALWVGACSSTVQGQAPNAMQESVLCYPATDAFAPMKRAINPHPTEQVVVIQTRSDSLSAIPADREWLSKNGERFVFGGDDYFAGPKGIKVSTAAPLRYTISPIGMLDGATVYASLPFESDTPKVLFVRLDSECELTQFWHVSEVR